MSNTPTVNLMRHEELTLANTRIGHELMSRSETHLTNKPPHYETTHKNADSYGHDKHNNHKLSKYHYHLKTDKIYGDKKLKLCGQCIMPAHLSNDLAQLQRFIKQRTLSSNTFTLNNNKVVTSKEAAESSIDEKFALKALDLTTERESGLNHPILIIPTELFQYKQLKRLHLDRNQIRTIPEQLGDSLVNLEILTMSNNWLSVLPNSFGNLRKLESLHLASNKFAKFPHILGELRALRFLDLSDNELAEVSTIVGNLKHLETLMLYKNCLKDLPESIGKLSRLRTLWLGDNAFKHFPGQLLRLDKLEWDELMLSSYLDGNPLVEPPMSVCNQGLSAIREYYKTNKIKIY